MPTGGQTDKLSQVKEDVMIGYVARMGAKRGKRIVLVGKAEGNSSLGRPGSR
jgi:hypothetical protein